VAAGPPSSQGPWALVTGASSGIGAGFARALGRRGYRLALVARRRERLEELAAEIGAARCAVLPADLSRPESVPELARELELRGIEIELLVNNAGLGTTGRFLEEAPGTTASLIAVNLMAPIALCRALGPAMRRRGRGAILNVVSMSAFQPVPFLATYAASKAALLSFSEALGEELRGTGVEVQALCPGLVHTGFQQQAGTDRVAFDRTPPMSVEFVVERALAGLERRRALVIPGWRDRLSVLGQRLLPRALVRRVAGALFRPAD
jgi:short-subunit dehydrogenase